MAAQQPARPTLLADAQRPLVLVGPPTHVQGQFHVQNLTEQKVVVRQPLLKGIGVSPLAQARGRRGAVGFPSTAAVALRRVVLRPGRSRPVPISLALDPSTPPGTYEALLDVDGEERPVVVHVTEHVALSISPDMIVMANQPGQKVHKQIVLANTGNAPVSMRHLGAVVLDDELAHCRALRGALGDVGDSMERLDDFVVALGRRYRTIYDTLALKVQNERVTVSPGETRAVELTITIPEKLDPRSRYTGVAPISTSTLMFTIVPD